MSQNKYPQMLYKVGTEIQFEGTGFDTKIVNDDDEFAQAEADGWHETPPGAIAAHKAAAEQAEQKTVPAAGNSRAELEAKATALNIPFSPRVSDKKLAEAIAQAEAGAGSD